MRLFVAVYPPESLQQRLVDWGRRCAAALEHQRAEINWSKTENIHITLKFLGETGDDAPGALANAISGAVQGVPPFVLSPGGVHPFPDQGELKMIWLDLAGAQSALRELAARVDQACEGLNYPRETRPFMPHLTLARFKTARGSSEIRRILHQVPPIDAEEFPVGSLSVVRSILSPAGPTYQTLNTIHLKAANP